MKILSSEVATANTATVKKLVALLTKASDKYYTSKRGDFYKSVPLEWPARYRDRLAAANGIITDKVFDYLWDELTKLDPTNKFLRQTGAPVKNKKMRIKLPFAMPSLGKIKEAEQVQNWLDTHPGPYVISGKKDGISIGLRKRGAIATLFTKGKNGVGGDISFMYDALRLPKIKGDLDARGEMIVRKDVFEKLYKKADEDDKEGFANPRAMAAGVTNRDTIHTGVRHVDTFFYDVIAPRVKPSQAFANLKAAGFTVVPHKVVKTVTAAQLPKMLAALRAKCKYELDGLVIVQDRKNPAPTADNPDHSVAYKDPEAYEVADVIVVKVEWNVTRTGKLFPRIIIKPTQIGGVKVTHVTGKSAMTIKKNHIGPGAVIRVQRAGDVIPDFVKTIKKVVPQMPVERDVGKWEWNGENIDLVEAHDTAALLGIEHFFTVIGVENFKAATISKFIDAGYSSIESICKLKRAGWEAVPGANRNIGKVYDQLQDKLQGIQLSTLMYASGVFGRAMGQRRFASVLKSIPALLTVKTSTAELTQMIDDVPGFDQITAKQIAVGIKPFIKWLKSMPKIDYRVGAPKIKLASTKMRGEYVVFTGVRDAEQEAAIISNGGEVGDSKTQMTILVAKDPNGSSSKIAGARAKGIPIYSLEGFKKKYKLS